MANKKKLPKAPPMSPVRQMAKMSDKEFKDLQKQINLFSGYFKYHMDRTKDKDGLDYFDRMKETAVQLKPMVQAEAKKRSKGRNAMKKKTVNKKAGQRVGTANYPGKKKVQPTPEELKGMKKKTAKKKVGGTVGTHNRLY